MLEYLLAREPEPFAVRGGWLVLGLGADDADEALKDSREELDRLVSIADRVPRHLFATFADDVELQQRCARFNARHAHSDHPMP